MRLDQSKSGEMSSIELFTTSTVPCWVCFIKVDHTPCSMCKGDRTAQVADHVVYSNS